MAALSIIDEIMLRHGIWIVGVGAAVILGLFMVYQHRGIQLRHRTLSDRPRLAEAMWFSQFGPVGAESRQVVRCALQAIAEDLRVDWTQLRPTDTFEETLRVHNRYSPIDDLDGAEYGIVTLAQKLGIPRDRLPGFQGNLESFLNRLVSVTTEGPRDESLQDGPRP